MFDHVRLSFNAVSTVLMCTTGVKYKCASPAVCAYANVIQKLPACVLIGAFAQIRTNMVYSISRG